MPLQKYLFFQLTLGLLEVKAKKTVKTSDRLPQGLRKFPEGIGGMEAVIPGNKFTGSVFLI